MTFVSGGCESTPTCPTDTDLSGTNCQATPTCPTGSTLSSGSCVGSNSCPSGLTYDKSIGECQATSTCPAGSDLSAGDCFATATCPAGTSFNSGDGYCVGDASCPSGFTYDTSNGECEEAPTCPVGTNLSGSVCAAPPICPSGYKFDKSTGECSNGSKSTAPTCPTGTSMDYITFQCESDPQCPKGSSFFSGNGQCLEESNPSAPICPTGTRYDEPASGCLGTPHCPKGSSLDSGICYAEAGPASPTCPAGSSLNGAGDSCLADPQCPKGSSFDTGSRKCLATASATPATCPAGTDLKLSSGQCQGAPQCPPGSFSLSGGSLCGSTPSFYCPPAVPTSSFGLCLEIGQPDLATLTAGKSASAADIGGPTAVAFDQKGDLWVVDTSNNRVLEYLPPFSTGETATLVIGQTSMTGTGDSTPAGGLYGPTALAFDSSGDLWAVDQGNNRVLEFTPPFTNGQLASLVIGQPTFGGYIGQTTKGGMNIPAYLAFDSSGDLWVTDSGNNRVVEYTTPLTMGEAASLVIGQPGFAGSDPGAGAKGLFGPLGVTFDSGGNLWVVDGSNHRVLEYNPPFTTDEAASLVIGQASLTTKTASASLDPYAITFDPAGNLWVSNFNRTVVQYTTPFLSGQATSQVLDQNGIGNGSTTTESELFDPQGVTFDSGGNLWVADNGHGRVVEYGDAVPSATTTSSSSSTSTSSTSGGVPMFPYQIATAIIFTLLLTLSYLLVRHGLTPRTSPTQKPSHRGA